MPRFSKYLIIVLVVGLIGYFSYHAFYGKRGFFSWIQVSSDLEELKKRLHKSKLENNRIASHVNMLKNNSLDADLLDEQAREVLGWNRKDEVIIIDPSYTF